MTFEVKPSPVPHFSRIFCSSLSLLTLQLHFPFFPASNHLSLLLLLPFDDIIPHLPVYLFALDGSFFRLPILLLSSFLPSQSTTPPPPQARIVMRDSTTTLSCTEERKLKEGNGWENPSRLIPSPIVFIHLSIGLKEERKSRLFLCSLATFSSYSRPNRIQRRALSNTRQSDVWVRKWVRDSVEIRVKRKTMVFSWEKNDKDTQS